MSDPVSWFVIEHRWIVESVDGRKIGKVKEVVGDSSHDIFNGIKVATGLLSRGRYVPASSLPRSSKIASGCRSTPTVSSGFDEYEEPTPGEHIPPE